jgi:hypothetical protein
MAILGISIRARIAELEHDDSFSVFAPFAPSFSESATSETSS